MYCLIIMKQERGLEKEKRENFKEVRGGESFHFKRAQHCTKNTNKRVHYLPWERAPSCVPITFFFFCSYRFPNNADVPKNTPFEERNQGRFASHDNEAALSSPNVKKQSSSLSAMEDSGDCGCAFALGRPRTAWQRFTA